MQPLTISVMSNVRRERMNDTRRCRQSGDSNARETSVENATQKSDRSDFGQVALSCRTTQMPDLPHLAGIQEGFTAHSLRRPRQREPSRSLPAGGGPQLDARPAASRSTWANDLGSVQAARRAVPPADPCSPSLPERALRVMTPRQEPYAVVPHVRICAGGGEQ